MKLLEVEGVRYCAPVLHSWQHHWASVVGRYEQHKRPVTVLKAGSFSSCTWNRTYCISNASV